MSERKAINKYYPPDYDPSQVPLKAKGASRAPEKVRLMLPFLMKCLLCTEYIAARRKFNARKEVTSERYMGIKIIKFHIKCPRCNNNIVFQTDPKSSGFLPVSGCVRNYQSKATTDSGPKVETEEEIFARLEREDVEEAKFQQLQSMRKKNPFWKPTEKRQGDAMAALEERLAEQQREQELQDHVMRLQAQAAATTAAGGHEAVAARARAQIDKADTTTTSHKRLAVTGSIVVKRAKKTHTRHAPATEEACVTVSRDKAVASASPARAPPEPSLGAGAGVSGAVSGYSSSLE